MKHVYGGHLPDRPNVSATDWCPLYRGLTKTQYQQNPISRTVVFPYSGVYKRVFFIDKNIIFKVLIFLYLNLISILVKKEDKNLCFGDKKIKTNIFRWLIFLFYYFCLGLHSYEQKKLLEKTSDTFLFLRFYSHFFHLFLQ